MPTSCSTKDWAGQVAIDSTDIEWLRAMLQYYGEHKATALINEIVAAIQPVTTDGQLAQARSVGGGEYLLALNNFVNLTLNVKLAGGPIDYFPLDPVALTFGAVGMNAKAPNPNTALLARLQRRQRKRLARVQPGMNTANVKPGVQQRGRHDPVVARPRAAQLRQRQRRKLSPAARDRRTSWPSRRAASDRDTADRSS